VSLHNITKIIPKNEKVLVKLETQQTIELTMRMATKQANVVFQSP